MPGHWRHTYGLWRSEILDPKHSGNYKTDLGPQVPAVLWVKLSNTGELKCRQLRSQVDALGTYPGLQGFPAWQRRVGRGHRMRSLDWWESMALF